MAMNESQVTDATLLTNKKKSHSKPYSLDMALPQILRLALTILAGVNLSCNLSEMAKMAMKNGDQVGHLKEKVWHYMGWASLA